MVAGCWGQWGGWRGSGRAVEIWASLPRALGGLQRVVRLFGGVGDDGEGSSQRH